MGLNKEELRKMLEDAGAIDIFGREVRMSQSPVQVIRQDDDDEDVKLQGYAAKFNKETVIGFWFKFREKISPGAFTKTIKESDIRHLFNHDVNWVLGRNKAGTLRLNEDKTGLFYDVDLNMNDPQGVSVFEKVDRGDVSQSSFAFIVMREEWQEPEDPDSGELPLRTILEARLFDTSSVTYPAYEDTTALIGSSASTVTLTELGATELTSAIAKKDFTPDLAPALREVAQRAEKLAVRCEGETCPQAAEEAPVGAEERAAEEAPEIEPVTITVTETSNDEHDIVITVSVRDAVVEEVIETDEDDWAERKRQLLVKAQDGITKQLQSLL